MPGRRLTAISAAMAVSLRGMPKVLVLFAHPRLERSRSNRALLHRFPQDARITLHDLYERYPDFNIDIAEEQRLAAGHDLLVLHHPVYWYSVPPLLKQWIDLVLAFGWAMGPAAPLWPGKPGCTRSPRRAHARLTVRRASMGPRCRSSCCR